MRRSPSPRHHRAEERIRQSLGELLLYETKDPRLEGVTVSDVEMSRDGSHARVYFSVFGDDERQRQAADGFAAAAPFLRRELGRRLRLRTVPELEIRRDRSFEEGDRMERLLSKLREEGQIPDDDGGDGAADGGVGPEGGEPR